MRETNDTDKVGVAVTREDVAGMYALSHRKLRSVYLEVMLVNMIDVSDLIDISDSTKVGVIDM